MNQEMLFETAPVLNDNRLAGPPMYRRSDPASSQIAARKMRETGAASNHEGLIIAALQQQPGLNAKQIAERTGLTNVQVSRRTSAMEKKGIITSDRNLPGRRPGLIRYAIAGYGWTR